MRGCLLFGCVMCEFDICFDCLSTSKLDTYLSDMPQLKCKSHTQIVNCVKWCPNYITVLRNGNALFASAAEDQTIKLWQLTTQNNLTAVTNVDNNALSCAPFEIVHTFDTSPLSMVHFMSSKRSLNLWPVKLHFFYVLSLRLKTWHFVLLKV